MNMGNKFNWEIIFKVSLLLVFLFLITSCQSGDSQDTIQKNFKQGIMELQIKLLPNAPPPKVYQNTDFKLIVELDNQAAYEIDNGLLKITGVDNQYIELFPDPLVGLEFEPLVGKSLVSPAGEKTFLEFDGRARNLFLNSESRGEKFFVKASYATNMEFIDTVCLDPNIYSFYDSGCKVEDKKTYGGQGAPLAVVDMEEIMYPGPNAGVEFRFQLKNRGKGKVGNVTLTKALMGNEELECNFQGTGLDTKIKNFKEKKQEAILICQSEELRSQGSYKTTVFLAFDYEYEIKVEKQINLVR